MTAAPHGRHVKTPPIGDPSPGPPVHHGGLLTYNYTTFAHSGAPDGARSASAVHRVGDALALLPRHMPPTGSGSRVVLMTSSS